MRIRQGATRWVLLGKKRAYKFPRMTSWRTFLNGLLGNMTEAEFAAVGHPLLAPVLFRIPGGFLNVMPVCKVWMKDARYLEQWWAAAETYPNIALTSLVEYKVDSVGILDGRIVAIDYG